VLKQQEQQHRGERVEAFFARVLASVFSGVGGDHCKSLRLGEWLAGLEVADAAMTVSLPSSSSWMVEGGAPSW
jgi:hypothetical protein